ncbi:hypothetical protein A0J61_11610, partial [Choanephora cucurbitarum]
TEPANYYTEKQNDYFSTSEPKSLYLSDPPVAIDEVLYQDHPEVRQTPLIGSLEEPMVNYLQKEETVTDKQISLADSLMPSSEPGYTNTYTNGKQQEGERKLDEPPRLEKSYPNPDKYPVPQFVPFYLPERVNFPHPVFKQNVRSLQSTLSTTTSQHANRNVKDKAVQLYGLIDKLKSPASSIEHQNTFRKMTRLFKEVPIRRIWNQGGIEESGSETWAGAQNDAGNFVETIQAVLPFLDGDNEKSSLTAIECIRQLAVTQAGLFRFFERKVDEQGRTLESQLLEKLLKMRSSRNPTICIAAEDTLDSILGTLNAPTVFELLMAFVIYRLLIVPFEDYPADIRYHPVGSAFMYLGRWVRELKDDFYIDEWLGKGGVNAFFEVKTERQDKSM